MVNVKVIVADDIIAAYNERIVTSPKLLETAFRRQITRLRKRILDTLQEDPGPVVYANNGRLRWKSEKQRRAYFATDGFGNGIPYRRTGQLLESYDVRIDPAGNGGSLLITNSDPSAPFVVGDDAQPYHLDTGWTQVADVVVEYEDIAADALIETWFTIIDPSGGVRR